MRDRLAAESAEERKVRLQQMRDRRAAKERETRLQQLRALYSYNWHERWTLVLSNALVQKRD